MILELHSRTEARIALPVEPFLALAKRLVAEAGITLPEGEWIVEVHAPSWPPPTVGTAELRGVLLDERSPKG